MGQIVLKKFFFFFNKYFFLCCLLEYGSFSVKIDSVVFITKIRRESGFLKGNFPPPPWAPTGGKYLGHNNPRLTKPFL